MWEEKPKGNVVELAPPKGEVRGLGVLRDALGKVKGKIVLGEGPPEPLKQQETGVK